MVDDVMVFCRMIEWWRFGTRTKNVSLLFFIRLKIWFCSIQYSFSCWPSAWKAKRSSHNQCLHLICGMFVVCRRPLHSTQPSPCLLIPTHSHSHYQADRMKHYSWQINTVHVPYGPIERHRSLFRVALSCNTTDTGLVHRVICPFTPQLSLVLINQPRRDGMLSWRSCTAATGGILNPRPSDRKSIWPLERAPVNRYKNKYL